ncbi:hypothetical protein B0H17DRAFT_1073262 [Mycena rosella]|uniref:DH domain-containing protein n=1 Tax=Mycena rosella TaxID=1033263 RepID=A0AAD7DC12_MYCRO|nr:hypothetical protein B0H17DRAFT_1073262 [Mycena rosella]
MLPSIRDRRSFRQPSPSTDSSRLAICGFLPMPPISASPVCTPTSTMHGEIIPTSTPNDFSEADVDHLLLRVLPTWTATPPTPPTKNIRRSVTCLIRDPPSSPLSPSASFPASAGGPIPNSAPRPSRPRALSDSSVTSRALTQGEVVAPVFRVASPESDPGSEPDDAWDREKEKDDVRKYHALMELLTTEVSYLADLRALFSIYLRNLPTLCRTASPFSRGSSSRNNSYTHLPKTSVLSDHGLHPLTTLQTKHKLTTRHLFTDREIDLLIRNAEEVLHLHENFVEELRTAMVPLGFPMEWPSSVPVDVFEEKERIRNIDAAVGAVTTKYATEASRFDAYQLFCTGHPEALQVAHRAQRNYPMEWEAYEQHCASLIANIAKEAAGSRPESLRSCSEGEEALPQPLPTSRSRKRTTSLTSIDGAVGKVRALASSKSEGSADGRRDKPSRPLAFLDYMIKPIQRICKYPLLLDQLRPGKTLRAMSHSAVRPHVNVVVESAAQAMRHVASAVDEARHRQDVAMQSSLIVSRIVLAHPSTATSHMSSIYPAFQMLTPSFLSSLGTCLLAGSLDVMHYQLSKTPSSGANINAKYLGAFLYLGGYLILVKVTKGKVYEPRHWFSIAAFDVVDLEEEDTSLPCTFGLSCKGHQFDLTAACQREKDAWLSSIHESRLHPPTWINEPTSSIQFDGKGELIPSTLDGPFEIINALPTIQSLPELAKDDAYPDLTEAVLATFRGEVGGHSQVVTQPPEIPSKPEPAIASRRSSTASVKAIFSPTSDSDTIIIRRSSPTARSQVDQGLQDVISEPLLAARSHASTRDALFQAPKILRTSFPRSNSALSLTGLTKNRLSRHESVRVPRRKSMIDDGTKASVRGAQKRRPKKLSIKSTSEVDSIFHAPSDFSPSPFSQCSSSTSNLTSPTLESPPVSQMPKSHRPSPVSNVRTLPVAPESPAPSVGSQGSNRADRYKTLTQGILKRWTQGPHHRRTRSAPYDQNVPETAVPSLVREQSPVLPDIEFGAALSVLVSPQQENVDLRPPSPPAAPPRRLHLLSSGVPITFRHSSLENTEPRIQNKRPSLFKRLKGIDIGLNPIS